MSFYYLLYFTLHPVSFCPNEYELCTFNFNTIFISISIILTIALAYPSSMPTRIPTVASDTVITVRVIQVRKQMFNSTVLKIISAFAWIVIIYHFCVLIPSFWILIILPLRFYISLLLHFYLIFTRFLFLTSTFYFSLPLFPYFLTFFS